MTTEPTRTTPRRRNPRGQGQLLRAELIEATARLLATLDVPETLTLRQVAREVGVAPASIYSHFPDLNALIEHVLRQRYAELAELMTRAAAGADDPLRELVARCATYVRWGVEQPGHYRTLFGGRMPADAVSSEASDASDTSRTPQAGRETEPETETDPTHGTGEELLSSLVSALARVTDPESSYSPEQHRRSGLLLWTAMHGLISLYNDHGDLPWPALDDLVAHLIGLHASRPASEIAGLLDQSAIRRRGADPERTAAQGQRSRARTGS